MSFGMGWQFRRCTHRSQKMRLHVPPVRATLGASEANAGSSTRFVIMRSQCEAANDSSEAASPGIPPYDSVSCTRSLHSLALREQPPSSRHAAHSAIYPDDAWHGPFRLRAGLTLAMGNWHAQHSAELLAPGGRFAGMLGERRRLCGSQTSPAKTLSSAATNWCSSCLGRGSSAERADSPTGSARGSDSPSSSPRRAAHGCVRMQGAAAKSRGASCRAAGCLRSPPRP
jgi:hypothetical protein